MNFQIGKRWLFFFCIINVAMIYAYYSINVLPIVTPIDSLTYIQCDAKRSVAYPLILVIGFKLFGNYQWLPFLQLICFAYALTNLSASVARLTQNWSWGVLVLFLTLYNHGIRYHVMMLTESFSMSLLCLYLARLADYLHAPRWQSLAKAAAFAGLAILMRPINYVCLVGLTVFVSLHWREDKDRRLQVLCASVLPVMSSLILGAGIFWYWHGEFATQSAMGLSLVGQAGVYAKPNTPSQDPTFMQFLSAKVMPFKNALQQCPLAITQCYFLAPLTDYVRFDVLTEMQQKNIAIDNASLHARAGELIRAAPWDFAYEALLNYAALWLQWDKANTTEIKAYTDCVTAQPILQRLQTVNVTLAQASMPTSPRLYDVSIMLLRIFQSLLYLFSIIAMFWVGVVSFKNTPPRVWLYFATTAVVLHSGFLATALLQQGVSRYALNFQACQAILIVLLTRLLLQKLPIRVLKNTKTIGGTERD